MCGIAGLWTFRGRADERVSQNLISAAASLFHRGPDDAAIWTNDKGVGLAHTRLAIIELSRAGAQPMLTASGDLAIVFNGEIYNHHALRAELSTLGHSFQGSSDTEVILASYKQWGESCADHFIGMFAFAIWDGNRDGLFLVRDRAGVKPLYFQIADSGVIFGSEIKALRYLSESSNFEIDKAALGSYLQYGYIPGPRTIYRGVEKLSPGTCVFVSRGGSRTTKTYWSPPSDLPVLEGRTFDQALQDLEPIVVDSIRHRLVSDVPVALFLSGGVDSSLVAATTALKLGEKLTAFTIGFEEDGYDEAAAAAQTAQRLGLKHVIRRVGAKERRALLDEWGWHFDEPFSDDSSFPTHFVSSLAAQDFKVALSGDGGDELFGGYGGYLDLPRRFDRFDRTPAIVRKAAAAALGGVCNSGFLDIRSDLGAATVRAAGGGWLLDRVNRAASQLSAAHTAELRNVYSSFWLPHEIGRLMGAEYSDDAPPWSGTRTSAEELMLGDFHRYLPDDVLVKSDRSSMAVGLEVREPLLDHRLIEFGFSLPLALRVTASEGKPLLRALLRRMLPNGLWDGPKKGFSAPITQWVRQWIDDGVWEEADRGGWASLEGVIDRRAMSNAYRSLRGDPYGLNRLWILLALERWARVWRVGPLPMVSGLERVRRIEG